MKKGFHHARYEVIALLDKRIEAEKVWMSQEEGYALSSARIMNILRELISEVHTLQDEMEELEEESSAIAVSLSKLENLVDAHPQHDDTEKTEVRSDAQSLEKDLEDIDTLVEKETRKRKLFRRTAKPLKK
ncbi:MAG: hypothetical protein WCJ25_02095 [Candidatus Moraniibacteriota bacterium]